MDNQLDIKLDEAYRRYYEMANLKRMAMVWTYQEWLNKSSIAAKIVDAYFVVADQVVAG